MAADQRFAPPAAQVEDIAPETGHQRCGSGASGRIGRLRCWPTASACTSAHRHHLRARLVAGATGLSAELAAASHRHLPIGTFSCCATVADMNMAGWWSIAALIPLVGWSGCSRQGRRPESLGPAAAANTLSVKIAGLTSLS
jgi:hypothetical protein